MSKRDHLICASSKPHLEPPPTVSGFVGPDLSLEELNARLDEIMAKVPELTDAEADEVAEVLVRAADDRAEPGATVHFEL